MKALRGIYIVKGGVKFYHSLKHNYFTHETMCFYDIKLRIKSEIWKSWAKILIGRRFRQYPQKV